MAYTQETGHGTGREHGAGHSRGHEHRPAADRTAVRWRGAPGQPRAVVLVLHGGRSEGTQRLRRWSLARLRMRPFVSALVTALHGERVAVGEVVYRVRGWNGDRADAAVDAAAALEQVAAAFGPVPVVLLGHSMGGRAALRVAGADQVTGVLALAPWCPPGEPYTQLAGRRLVTLHDVADRVTDPRETRAFAANARAAGAEAAGFAVRGSNHAMLGRRRVDWQTVSTGLVAAMLGLCPFPDEVSAALALRGGDPGGLELELPSR
ncbi:alpha/beta fold hydrolase [Streptacidiphilus cavernicola]|uniref:Alpha/beta fold hydrolase n=1 Tax=Streptacidiphilus cavernicola TaxID=3342716 RepID=A0ABV6VPV7_9ACTN